MSAERVDIEIWKEPGKGFFAFLLPEEKYQLKNFLYNNKEPLNEYFLGIGKYKGAWMKPDGSIMELPIGTNHEGMVSHYYPGLDPSESFDRALIDGWVRIVYPLNQNDGFAFNGEAPGNVRKAARKYFKEAIRGPRVDVELGDAHGWYVFRMPVDKNQLRSFIEDEKGDLLSEYFAYFEGGDKGAWMKPDGNIVTVSRDKLHADVARLQFYRNLMPNKALNQAIKDGYVRITYPYSEKDGFGFAGDDVSNVKDAIKKYFKEIVKTPRVVIDVFDGSGGYIFDLPMEKEKLRAFVRGDKAKLNESTEDSPYEGVKEKVKNSKKLPAEMKEKILPLIVINGIHGTRYNNGVVTRLKIPKVKGKSFNGVDLGADKNGFFALTHRARCSSYSEISKIPDGKIKFIESTG